MFLLLRGTGVFVKSILRWLAQIENKIDKINTQQELIRKNAVITLGCAGGIASRHALAIKNYEGVKQWRRAAVR